jgi:type II secretory pathway predicted ATPase ExeA
MVIALALDKRHRKGPERARTATRLGRARMYQHFFGMGRKPFGLCPQLNAYYPAATHEEALAAARYALLEGSGIALIVGECGLGKTLLCLRLASLLEPSYAVALVTHTNLATVKAFYQAVHYDLGLPYFGLDEQELRMSYCDFLLHRCAAGGSSVLIVDEAQHLPDRVLEEIRILADSEAHERRLLRIVLAAQPSLLERLARPEFAALRQRIAVEARLAPLPPKDVAGYVRAQLRYAGVDADRFLDPKAYNTIAELSQGIPRLINRLCDVAFLLAFCHGQPKVDETLLRSAWEDLIHSAAEPSMQAVRAPVPSATSSSSTPLDRDTTPRSSVSRLQPTWVPSEERFAPDTGALVSAASATKSGQDDSDHLQEELVEEVVQDFYATLQARRARVPVPDDEDMAPHGADLAPAASPPSDEPQSEEEDWACLEIGPEDSLDGGSTGLFSALSPDARSLPAGPQHPWTETQDQPTQMSAPSTPAPAEAAGSPAIASCAHISAHAAHPKKAPHTASVRRFLFTKLIQPGPWG